MSKGSRNRTANYEEYGKSIERIRREEKRRRELAEKHNQKKETDECDPNRCGG
jgi:hypothetical protein